MGRNICMDYFHPCLIKNLSCLLKPHWIHYSRNFWKGISEVRCTKSSLYQTHLLNSTWQVQKHCCQVTSSSICRSFPVEPFCKMSLQFLRFSSSSSPDSHLCNCNLYSVLVDLSKFIQCIAMQCYALFVYELNPILFCFHLLWSCVRTCA